MSEIIRWILYIFIKMYKIHIVKITMSENSVITIVTMLLLACHRLVIIWLLILI